MNALVELRGEVVRTDSLKVAAEFGKHHHHVMLTVRELVSGRPDLASNFGLMIQTVQLGKRCDHVLRTVCALISGRPDHAPNFGEMVQTAQIGKRHGYILRMIRGLISGRPEPLPNFEERLHECMPGGDTTLLLSGDDARAVNDKPDHALNFEEMVQMAQIDSGAMQREQMA